jgi:hypothetical protein
LIFVVEIQAYNISQVTLDESEFVSICAHVADIVLVAKDEPRLNVVPPLARLAVGLLAVVVAKTLVTLTSEGSFGVDALLGTRTGQFSTLVNVLTSLAVSHELVSGIALALETLLGVDTLVIATIVLNTGAFIDAAMKRFIAAILTILFLVADEVVGDTLFVVQSRDGLALELVVGASVVVLAI